jgi:hypothetical protein
MPRKSTATIQRLPDNNPAYEITCNKPGHNFDFTMAETLTEAKECKANPVNWCMSCNEEFFATKAGA